ncbi:MAG: hypothetical protein JST35_03955 [Armatimonadetes bacterium]|nr:hypothetical protein [Armatimonadota bacterium]
MSYDINLVRVKEGEDPYEVATNDEDFDREKPYDPEKEAMKRRTADALVAKFPNLEVFEVDDEDIAAELNISVEEAKRRSRHIELNNDAAGVQIHLDDDEAGVSIAYWHNGDKAREVFREVWDYLRIIQRETGFVAFDPQQGEILVLSQGYAAAVDAFAGGMVNVQRVIDDLNQPKKKPWWKFW